MNKRAKITTRRVDPFVLNPTPSSTLLASDEWRRKNAEMVQTEILKPESYLPVSTGSSGRSPICFTIKSIPHSLIDGKNICIEMAFSLQKYKSFNKTKDGKAATEETDKTDIEVHKKWVDIDVNDRVMAVANTYCSIFEDLNISINGIMVESSGRDFAIKSYLQNVLFTTEQERQTWLDCGILDITHTLPSFVAPEMDLGRPEAGARRSKMSHGPAQTYGRLLSDVLCSNQPIPDNADISIKLFPAKSEACIITDSGDKTEYRILVTDCSLYVPRITPKISTTLSSINTYTQWKVLSFTHQAGQSNFKKDLAFGETLPQKAIVVFTSEKAYNGEWKSSKFDFQHSNATNVLMKCNQRHLPFINGYSNDWEAGYKGVNVAFTGLTTELGAKEHAIHQKGFVNGFGVFGFDLTPNKTGNISLDKALKGALDLSVTFDPAPKENLMVVVLLIYASSFGISKNGVFSHE